MLQTLTSPELAVFFFAILYNLHSDQINVKYVLMLFSLTKSGLIVYLYKYADFNLMSLPKRKSFHILIIAGNAILKC